MRKRALIFIAVTVAAIVPACERTERGKATPDSGSPAERQIATPDGLDAILTAVEQAQNDSDNERARVILAEAVRTYPRDHALRVTFGNTLLALNEPEPARRQYEEALSIGPRSAPVLLQAGLAARSAGDDTRGLALLAEASRVDPTRADIACQHGIAMLDTGALDDAHAELLRAVALDDSSSIAWGSLAEVTLRQNRPALAQQHAAVARRLAPQTLAWRVIEARALKRIGEPESALALLQVLVPPDRYQPGVLATAAECLGFLGKPAEAAAWFEEALRASPDDAELAREAAAWRARAEAALP
ncbi:MAG: hypothetical protein AAF235_05165 [Planctomycetota bacterium]